MTDSSFVRNFCIIAHIDHGKSTLADRLMEVTQTVSRRDMRDQLLDQMDLERERGITIKLQPVHMVYVLDGQEYELNLIDTPGHVDFTYEVSRSLAACEGALLVVDASQGIQAQTVANLYLAIEQGLEIIPVVNKIDLPNADVPKTKRELVKLLGCKEEEIIEVSGKTGLNVPKLLEVIVHKVPVPRGDVGKPFRALIFDSAFDEYRGVIAYVRVVDGEIQTGDKIQLMATAAQSDVLDMGFLKPQLVPNKKLSAGDVGYIVTGLKSVADASVGDTIKHAGETVERLEGYRQVRPMVFAGLYPENNDAYPQLREALEKLKLNDSSLQFEPDHSEALGFGFRCGFLGLLHLEITQERLRREYNLPIIATIPSVAYLVTLTNAETVTVTSPVALPPTTSIDHIQEPWVKADIVVPKNYLGNVMQLIAERRGVYTNTEYLDEDMAVQHVDLPLASIIVDFYDRLKSVTSGFASMSYIFSDYRQTRVERLDIVIAEERVEALATMVYTTDREAVARALVKKLKEILPRQMFEVKIQAVINFHHDGKNKGGKVIASERISAMRKDVTAKLYGGDVTRKRKLLEKQKKGKKRMAGQGRVHIPPEAYLAVLKKD